MASLSAVRPARVRVGFGSGGARAAVALGLLLSLGLAALHLEYYRNAGALWRDEVNSVNLATMPSWTDVLANMGFDSFPVAWTALLRTWAALGLAQTDAALRSLGLVIGLATVAVLWWTGFRLGVGPPLGTLVVYGMSPTAIIYGDEVRGYGLAALGIAWCLGAIWSWLERPTWGRLLVAQAAAIFAVQTHFPNCNLLLAMGAGVAAVAVRRRRWAVLLPILGVGAVAALWLFVLNFPALLYMTRAGVTEQASRRTLGWLVQVFAHGLAPGVPALGIAWLVAALLAALGLGASMAAPKAEKDTDRALYATVTLVIAVVGIFFAFAQLRVPTNYWHYLSLMVVVALACDVGIWLLAQRFRNGPWLRLGAVALVALLVMPRVAATVPLRMTNVDLAANELTATARPGDLVVVVPWYCGITFQRYYRGRAPWITVPDFERHEFHTHLLVAEKMKQGESAIGPELARIERTLRGGGTVWVVGQAAAPDPGHAPPPLPPLPPEGGPAARYLDTWELRVGALLEDHARSGGRVPLPEPGPVNAWESLPLFRVEGWR
jgi:hypothetical protein